MADEVVKERDILFIILRSINKTSSLKFKLQVISAIVSFVNINYLFKLYLKCI